MRHTQCGLCCRAPLFFRTRCSNDSGGLSVETGTLHSDAHNGDSGRSSLAFPTSSLETPWSSEVCSLRLRTSVRCSFHQRALLTTRNKVGIFYSLAPPNRRTDGTCQPRVGPVPPAICKRAARRLVRPLTHGGVTPYKTLGKLSDILHLNNRNNQLKRQARPPRNVPLDA